jgi:hypothetical protein
VSIPVDVTDLAPTLARFDAAFLLTVSGDGRVKVVSARPVLDGDLLVVAAPGRGSLANVGLNAQVTLLWPAREPGGHSLLVDGQAAAHPDGLRVRPTSAVLHAAG